MDARYIRTSSQEKGYKVIQKLIMPILYFITAITVVYYHLWNIPIIVATIYVECDLINMYFNRTPRLLEQWLPKIANFAVFLALFTYFILVAIFTVLPIAVTLTMGMYVLLHIPEYFANRATKNN